MGECLVPSINQPLNNWNVSNVAKMSMTFMNATSFNQPLNNWNVSNVTNMGAMFKGNPFNQLLNTGMFLMLQLLMKCLVGHPHLIETV